MQPDSTDWKIIDILREGYETNNAIGRRLSLSEGTVRQRIKRLKDAGILRIRGLINPEVLENRQVAVIGMRVAESRLLDVKAREIAALAGVLSVSLVSGRYDLMVEVLVDSNQGLVRFLTEELSRVKDIAQTETFLNLKSYRKYI